MPVLKLLDDSNSVGDKVSLDKWKTDTISEYLTERLRK
jgi:hypothetical protein